MYKVISFFDFCDEFEGTQYKDQFSYEGKRALFDYLESIEEDEKGVELDIVDLACNYTEYVDLKELQEDYEIDSMEKLEKRTSVIRIEGTESFIIEQF